MPYIKVYIFNTMSGGMPIRCFTCGKVVGNMYDEYTAKIDSGIESAVALDELKLGRECCRRMLSTHVDVTKYQLLFPTYENGVQRLGSTEYSMDDDVEVLEEKPKPKMKAKVKSKRKTVASKIKITPKGKAIRSKKDYIDIMTMDDLYL
jgi:DNA-directed RNA polymerase I, II, and III subunit RPABC5